MVNISHIFSLGKTFPICASKSLCLRCGAVSLKVLTEVKLGLSARL